MAQTKITEVMMDDKTIDASKEIAMVFSIANTLRGPYKPDKYKDVIIPMIILRRLECALAPTKKAVVDAFKKNPAAPAQLLCKKSGYQFYNTCEFDLKKLLTEAPAIVENLTFYIESFSPNVQAIFEELKFKEEIKNLDKNNRLLGVVKKFSELDLDPERVDGLKMGYMFEEIIRRFSENAEAGDHYTPREVIRLLTSILLAEGCSDVFREGREITVLDMACGTGGMLSTAHDFIVRMNPDAKVRLFGQENNDESHAICLADMLIKNQAAENIRFADTMKEDCFEGTPKTLEQLEREGVFIFPEIIKDAEDITQDQMILQSVNDTYRTSNVMGFLGCGDERLIIESRFSGDGEDFFFQYLLDRVLDFPNIVDMDADANHNNRLFNFLLFLFPHYLKAAMRKGLFKKYIRRRYNDGNVKGTIDVARHIEKNTPFAGNVAYSQREFSYDNSLMELVRHTVEFIKRKPYGNKLLIKVKDEVKLVIDATPGYEPYDRQKIIEQNKKNTVRHAYFREYLALQRLCLLILRHQKHQIGTGARQIYGILFDGAWLWEEYINSLVEGMFYHPMNKGGKGAQRLFEGNVGLIYPDFISRNSEMRIIADAKYKPIDNIGNRDYLQVLAYMFRFDAKTGYYFYPEAGDSDDLKLRMNRGSTYEKKVSPRDDICVTKHGLKIPMDASDYSDFISRMEISERAFINAFSTNAI